MSPKTRVKPPATRKYSAARVSPLSAVVQKSLALSTRPQTVNAATGTPRTTTQNQRQNRDTRSASGHRAAPAGLGGADLGLLVEHAILHHGEELGLVAQNAEVGEGVPVHQDQVGKVAVLELAELAALHHDLAAVAGGREQRLHRRHPEILHEVLEVTGVLAVRGEGEAVVAAGEHTDAALV